MAEINLGNIKFNWKGAYAGGTAYVVDDVVSYLGSSYVCILASTGNVPTNGTYWNLMAEAGTDGTNGTDVLTTLTTTGDMLYRDGSGAQRLGIGTAAQELRVNSGATAPEWYTPAAGGGKIKSITTSIDNSQRSTSSTSYTEAGNSMQLSVTPATTTSKFLVSFDFTGGGSSTSARYYFSIKRNTGGVSTFLGNGEVVRTHEVASASMTENPMTINFADSPGHGGAVVTYNVVIKVQSGTGYINTNGTGIGVLIEYI